MKRRSDGDGSVYQVHVKGCPDRELEKPKCKCRWRGAVVVGYRTKGDKVIPVRKTVSANSRSTCAERVRELREKHAAEVLPVGRTPTVKEWLDYCHATLLPRQGRRPNTLIAYRRTFDNYLIPLLGHVRLDRLTRDDIEAAYDILLETGNPRLGGKATPLSPSMVHYVHTVLRRMLRLAVQRKRAATNPAGPDSMDAPAKSDREIEPLATDDWKAVLTTATGDWNAARWTVALAIGLRQGEALALRWEDVDLETGMLRVRQTVYRLPGRGHVFGPPKTDRAKRDIVLPAPLVAELRAHRKVQTQARLAAGDQWQDTGLVFTMPDGRVIDARYDSGKWHDLLRRAGVKPIKLHAARHTAATILLLEGIDPRVVMDIMGWSQISTAANYQHAVSEAKQAAAVKMGSAVWGS